MENLNKFIDFFMDLFNKLFVILNNLLGGKKKSQYK